MNGKLNIILTRNKICVKHVPYLWLNGNDTDSEIRHLVCDIHKPGDSLAVYTTLIYVYGESKYIL